jgi:very-short-patch-repair endonuclease
MDKDRDLANHAPSLDVAHSFLPRKTKADRPPQTAKDRAVKRLAKIMRRRPTGAEGKLWQIVRDRRFSGFKFRRQVTIGSYIVDFVCFERKLIAEADGSQHNGSVRDESRDAWFRSQGFRVRRFWNGDILLRPTEVKDTLWADLDGQTDI